MLGKEAERFIRTKWASVQELAEELYAIFRPELKIDPAGITINQLPNDATPPFQINGPADATGPAITITRGGTTITFGTPGGGDTGGGGGGSDLGGIGPPGATPSATDNPIVLYGEVQGQIGGNNYTVRLWAKAPLSNPALGDFNVRFPAVDVADVVPTGYACLVIAFPATVGGARVFTDALALPPVFIPPA